MRRNGRRTFSWFKYSSELNINDKLNDRKYKNKRPYYYKVEDKIAEKYGTKWNKYSEHYRKLIDTRFNLVPITGNVSGIKNKSGVSNENITPYCYNNISSCPFWRKNESTGVVSCDAYDSDNTEIDNSRKDYEKAFRFYKTSKKIYEMSKCIALFDMVDICGFKHSC